MSDPLRIVWDALAAGGYRPCGELHDFRARCPGHDGENPTSLHVWDSGGVAMLYCHAHGCSVQDIVEPLSLRVRDLFPVELQYRSTRLSAARRQDFTGNARVAANALAAIDRLGLDWRLTIGLDECPNCESPHPQLVIDSTGAPFLHCQRGCSVDAFRGGLVERLTQRRRAA
jgi:hypothetical protein